MYEQARHECGVRFLCHLRHKKGLAWFRNYISEKNFSQALLNDFYDQWKLGNKGEWGMLETIKWTGTILCLIGIALTSFNFYPINIYLGFIGSTLWAYAGYKQKDYALFLVEFVAVAMYFAGIMYI